MASVRCLICASKPPPSVSRPAPGQPPFKSQQIQFGQIWLQLQAQVGEADIGGGRDQLLVGKSQPQPQGAAALRQGHRIIDPGAPDGKVGIVQFGVDLAFPFRQPVEIAPPEIAADVDACRESARRFGGEAEAMAAAVVVELKVQALQFQWRCVAQLVAPGDAGIADDDAILGQQPVGEVVFVPACGVISSPAAK